MGVEAKRECLYCWGSDLGHEAPQPVLVLTELFRLVRKWDGQSVQ